MRGRTPAVVMLLVSLASAEFVFRGPVQWIARGAEGRNTDLTGPFLGTRAWLRGLNPYTSDVYWTLAEESQPVWGAGRNSSSDDFESRTPYPLTTFVLLAPVAVMPWPVARVLTVVLMALLLAGAIFALSSIDSQRHSRWRRGLFLAFALALAPVHSGLSAGNLVAAAVAVGVFAICAAMKKRSDIAGILLAGAVCLKPQIAAPFVLYFMARKEWRILASTTLCGAIVAAVGVGRLALAGTSWFSDYVFNNRLILADDGSSIIQWSPAQSQFINLQALGFGLPVSARVANIASIGLAAAFVMCWLFLLRRRGGPVELLGIATIAVISLLPVYHRTYDAALLLLPLCWAMMERDPRAGHTTGLVVLLLVPFLVPGNTIVEILDRAGRLPASITGSWLWSLVVLPHQTWALLGLAVVLLVASRRLST